jgi:hypothetical protein
MLFPKAILKAEWEADKRERLRARREEKEKKGKPPR